MTNLLNKLVIASLVCLCFSGCATVKALIPNAEIPASLTQECRPLEQLAGMTGKDLITNITNNAAIYYECADSKHALNEAVKPKK